MTKKKSFFTLPVIGLILLSFFLGTSEYIVVGILPEISEGLHISLTQAGSIVSGFAFAYGLGTPFCAAFAAKYNRFRFLMGGILFFAVCNLICALAPGYGLFMLFRVFTAVISGTLVAVSMTFAEDIASPEHVSKVVAGIFSGFSISAVFGVPIATTISQMFGWRAAFYVIFGATLLLLLLLSRVLPRENRRNAQGVLRQFLLFRDKRILAGVAIVFLGGASTYTFYTYLTPIFQSELKIPEQWISIALLIFGVAAIISNVSSGRMAEHNGLKKLPFVYAVQTVCMLLLPLASGKLVLGGILIFTLGVLMYLLNSPLQMHFLQVAAKDYPDCVNLASSFISVFFNFGIAVGSAAGGRIVDRWALKYVGIGGAGFAVFAVFFCILLLRETTARPLFNPNTKADSPATR